MSNDGNERGHDTAAQTFQVGDRVRLNTSIGGAVGTILEPTDDTPAGYEHIKLDHAGSFDAPRRQLETIDTPAPAQTDIRIGDLVEFAAFNSALKGEVDAIHDDEAAVMVPAWDGYTALFVPLALLTMLQRPAPENPRIVYKPATPAPTATPPALELPVMVSCGTCNGHQTLHNDAWPDETDYPEWVDCPECGGLGYHERTIRLTDDALNRLAGELANRLARVVRRSAGLRF